MTKSVRRFRVPLSATAVVGALFVGGMGAFAQSTGVGNIQRPGGSFGLSQVGGVGVGRLPSSSSGDFMRGAGSVPSALQSALGDQFLRTGFSSGPGRLSENFALTDFSLSGRQSSMIINNAVLGIPIDNERQTQLLSDLGVGGARPLDELLSRRGDHLAIPFAARPLLSRPMLARPDRMITSETMSQAAPDETPPTATSFERMDYRAAARRDAQAALMRGVDHAANKPRIAQQDFETARLLNPDDPRPYIGVCYCAVQLGNIRHALTMWEMGLARFAQTPGGLDQLRFDYARDSVDPATAARAPARMRQIRTTLESSNVDPIRNPQREVSRQALLAWLAWNSGERTSALAKMRRANDDNGKLPPEKRVAGMAALHQRMNEEATK